MICRNLRALFLAGLAALSGCGPSSGREASVDHTIEKAPLGLMTSLPIYWPLAADMTTLASGEAAIPWQRAVMEERFELIPLDTLSPIAGLNPEEEPTDPLAGLERLAIIQPRGLSPSDNVALDLWVRKGGRLLMVLDPALTGHYELPLGDPRLPTIGASIPPVITRWGMEVTFDETQNSEPREVAIGDVRLPIFLGGEISVSDAECIAKYTYPITACRVGKGVVTLLADAAVFEHGGATDHHHHDDNHAHEEEHLEIEGSVSLISLMQFAFPS